MVSAKQDDEGEVTLMLTNGTTVTESEWYDCSPLYDPAAEDADDWPECIKVGLYIFWDGSRLHARAAMGGKGERVMTCYEFCAAANLRWVIDTLELGAAGRASALPD